MGPFKVLARTEPNTYRLDIRVPARATLRSCARMSSTSSACARTGRTSDAGAHSAHMGGDAAPPPPAAVGADGEPEHEVLELLKFKMHWGRPYVLVRWMGHDASGDSRERQATRTRGSRSTT